MGARIPFESDAQKELAIVRQNRRRSGPMDLMGYLAGAGEAMSVRGTEDGPYSLIVGRASINGAAAAPLTSEQGGIVATGESQRLLTDEYGRLWTRGGDGLVGSQLTPIDFRTTTASFQTAPILPAGQQMRLRTAGASVAGGTGAGLVLMVFDSAAAVVNGNAPVWWTTILDPGAGYFADAEVSFQESDGLILAQGLVIAISTTLGTLTLPAAANGFYRAIYTLE